MSAWICSPTHINFLTTLAIKFDLIDGKNPTTVSNMLLAENYKSVNYRYNENNSQTIVYKPVNLKKKILDKSEKFELMVAYKQISCYMYQACEHDTWEDSEAYKLCNEMIKAICTKLGLTEEQLSNEAVFSDAPWGI